jgi:uncharacterized protein (TIGR03435 family)
MRDHAGRPLNASRKLFLTAAVVTALAVLVVVGTLTAPRLSSAQASARTPAGQSSVASGDRLTFDAVSVKPNKSGDNRSNFQFQPGGRFITTNYTLRTLISLAYAPGLRRMIAAPEWDGVLSEHFDIEAKAEVDPTREQRSLLLQSLLADRFKLVVHFETRPIPIYALVLSSPGKMGPGLKPHSDDVKCIPAGPQQQGLGEFPTPWCGGVRVAPIPGGLRQIGNKVTIDVFANLLALSVDRVVVDRTGLSGYFDSDFEYAFTQAQGAVPQPSVDATDPSAPASIFTAMQEQLGLKLEARVEPVYALVVDHVEEPSPN